ncbi:MAG: hypothetical protein VSS75_020025 [Candidatus Parabeggiatoa sp.]|nr:hypothetical protein [Candidatus Parabeggiatoa sp.]
MNIKPVTCPVCKRKNHIIIVKKKSNLTVRNEKIEVTHKFFKCKHCNVEFEDFETKDDLDEAYTVYRHRHNMLHPENFTKWRESLGLSIEDISHLLKWNPRKLGLYEHGLLQTKEEDIQLKKIMREFSERRVGRAKAQ